MEINAVIDINYYISPFLSGGVTPNKIKDFNRTLWLLEVCDIEPVHTSFSKFTLGRRNALDKLLDFQIVNNLVIEHIHKCLDIASPSTIRKSPVWRNDQGIIVEYCNPKNISDQLLELYQLYNNVSTIEEVVRCYITFNNIHPFLDGNGRVSRILLEMALKKIGVLSIFPEMYFVLGFGEKYKINHLNFFEICESAMIESIIWGMAAWSDLMQLIQLSEKNIELAFGITFNAHSTEIVKQSLLRPLMSQNHINYATNGHSLEVIKELKSKCICKEMISPLSGKKFIEFSESVHLVSKIDQYLFN